MLDYSCLHKNPSILRKNPSILCKNPSRTNQWKASFRIRMNELMLGRKKDLLYSEDTVCRPHYTCRMRISYLPER